MTGHGPDKVLRPVLPSHGRAVGPCFSRDFLMRPLAQNSRFRIAKHQPRRIFPASSSTSATSHNLSPFYSTLQLSNSP